MALIIYFSMVQFPQRGYKVVLVKTVCLLSSLWQRPRIAFGVEETLLPALMLVLFESRLQFPAGILLGSTELTAITIHFY